MTKVYPAVFSVTREKIEYERKKANMKYSGIKDVCYTDLKR